MFLELLTTVTLSWTNPTVVHDLMCLDSTATAHLTGAKLYRQYLSDPAPLFVRAHLYVDVPARDTVQLPDAPIATYWIRAMNAAGESDCPSTGRVVGIPVGVAEGVQRWRRHGWRHFDLMGRHMEPGPSGIYFGDTLRVRIR